VSKINRTIYRDKFVENKQVTESKCRTKRTVCCFRPSINQSLTVDWLAMSNCKQVRRAQRPVCSKYDVLAVCSRRFRDGGASGGGKISD